MREGGKCRVPAPMTVRPRATPHLICRCVTSRSLYVRMMVSLVKSLAASVYAVVHSEPYKCQLDNFQQVKNV